MAVQGQFTAVDLGDQLPAELLERLGGNHLDAFVGAFDQIAVLAEMGSIGRRKGYPAFVVELALMRPNEHHSRLTTFSTRSTCLDAGERAQRPRSPLTAIMYPEIPHCQPFLPTTSHQPPSEPSV